MKNYSLLIMGVSNGDEDGGGVDGDGSGGTSRPGRVPKQRLLSPELGFLVAAELRNSSGEIVDSHRVFEAGGLYRRRGDVGGHPWAPHHVTARQKVGPRRHVVRPPSRATAW